MGYFSNGTEGQLYEEKYCYRCVNGYGMETGDYTCPIMVLHLLHNYDECNKPDSFLHVLIPRKNDGFNARCEMFHPRPEGPDGEPQCAECWRREAEKSGQTSLIDEPAAQEAK